MVQTNMQCYSMIAHYEPCSEPANLFDIERRTPTPALRRSSSLLTLDAILISDKGEGNSSGSARKGEEDYLLGRPDVL